MRQAPYLITSLNEMPGRARWVESVRRMLGDSVQPVIIMWEPAFAVPPNWIVHRMGRAYPGHLEKLLPLLTMALDPDRWFVFTDGSDVLFQRPLPDLDQAGVPILVSNEGVLHRDCPFWAPHLRLPWFAGLEDQPIFNIGSWAAIGHDFLAFLRALSGAMALLRSQGLPMVHVHEQLFYNCWIRSNRARVGEMPGLFCTLYANLSPGGAARLAGGQVVDHRGAPYAVVHGNGSTKSILDGLGWASDGNPAEGRRTGE
jgi:hypothetical protein